jgi:hypothetical protein
LGRSRFLRQGGSLSAGTAMSQPRDDRQDDLFRSDIEQIISLRHPRVRLVA